MIPWSQFAAARPALAGEATRLFFGHDVGLGFLATTRPDGGPRVHPICPLLAGDLYGFIVPGPKLEDLRRDGRYALHSETVPPPHHHDAAYLTGRAVEHDDLDLRQRLTEHLLAERGLSEPWPGFERETLVEFLVDRVLITLTVAGHDLPAGHSIWSADD